MSLPRPVSIVSRPAPAQPVRAPRQALSLAGAVVETILGRRPLHQLRPHLSGHAFLSLARYVEDPHLRRAAIRRVRSQMPTERAVEASVTLDLDGRALSCVLRLDVHRGSWRCTHLTVLTPLGAVAA